MHSLTTATVIAFCAISALAVPQPARRDEWQPTTSTASFPEGAPVPAPTDHPNTEWQPEGNQTCVYITSNYQWMGYGLNLCNPAGVCSDKLPDGLSRQVLSVGPSAGQVCFLYSGQYCTGNTSDPIVHPGRSNLNDIDFGNVAESWKCYKMWPPEDPNTSSSSSMSSAMSTSSSVISTATLSSASSTISTMSTATSSPAGSTKTIFTVTTISVSSVPTTSISVSTTLSTFSDPQTTPGGIPISRTLSASKAKASSMSTSTMTLTVLSASSSTSSSTLSTTTTTRYVSPVPLPMSSKSCSGTLCSPTSSSTLSSSTLTSDLSTQRGQPAFGDPLMPPFSGMESTSTGIMTATSSFTFNPASPTFVTHTYANGAVMTTTL